MRPAKIYVSGEALIDFVPAQSDLGPAFAPRCGGSNFNTAKAAARQGADVEFIGALSTDMFGDRLAADLEASGVGLTHSPRVADPSTLAFVEFDGSDARYAFFNERSATQMMDHSNTRLDPAPGDILHTGSFSLVSDPGGASIVELARSLATRLTVSIDPNARSTMIPDLEAWRARIDSLFEIAGIVKLSDEDLSLLRPGTSAEEMLHSLLERGVALAMVTFGPEGAMAATRTARVTVPARRGKVVDTVGCGDTVMGTLLAALAGKPPEEIAEMDGDAVGRLASRAMAAASLNARESGCHPPVTAEIDAELART